MELIILHRLEMQSAIGLLIFEFVQRVRIYIAIKEAS